MNEEYIRAIEANHARMEVKITELVNLVNEKQAAISILNNRKDKVIEKVKELVSKASAFQMAEALDISNEIFALYSKEDKQDE